MKPIQFSSKLQEEIKFQQDTFAESADSGEVLRVQDALQRMIQDMDDPGVVAYEFRRELQNIGIELGLWKPYTKAQIDEIVVMGGRGRKYCFKRGDRYYVWDSWKPLGL